MKWLDKPKRWLIIKNGDRGPVVRVMLCASKPMGSVDRRTLATLGGGKSDYSLLDLEADQALVFQLPMKRQTPGSKGRFMSKRQEEYAALIQRLGGKCERCGSTKRLEVHHPKGRGYEARKMSSTARIKKYLEEEKAGVDLGVLCKPCNSSEH